MMFLREMCLFRKVLETDVQIMMVTLTDPTWLVVIQYVTRLL